MQQQNPYERFSLHVRPRIRQHPAMTIEDSNPCIAQEGGGLSQFLQFTLMDHRPHQGHCLTRHGLSIGSEMLYLLLADISFDQR